MRLSSPFYLLFVVFVPKFLNAQAPLNPLTNPGCSTIYSIVESCISKTPGLPTLPSSVAFSCLCYDSLNNYAPTVYGNAATTCLDFIISAYSTTDNPFGAYAAGFCTDPSFVPVATTPPITIGATAGRGSSSIASATPGTTTVSTATANPTSASGSLSSNSAESKSITSAPSSPTSQSDSSSSAGASVASTSLKAEGAKMGFINRDGTLWSIFGFILAALFVL